MSAGVRSMGIARDGAKGEVQETAIAEGVPQGMWRGRTAGRMAWAYGVGVWWAYRRAEGLQTDREHAAGIAGG